MYEISVNVESDEVTSLDGVCRNTETVQDQRNNNLPRESEEVLARKRR